MIAQDVAVDSTIMPPTTGETAAGAPDAVNISQHNKSHHHHFQAHHHQLQVPMGDDNDHGIDETLTGNNNREDLQGIQYEYSASNISINDYSNKDNQNTTTFSMVGNSHLNLGGTLTNTCNNNNDNNIDMNITPVHDVHVPMLPEANNTFTNSHVNKTNTVITYATNTSNTNNSSDANNGNITDFNTNCDNSPFHPSYSSVPHSDQGNTTTTTTTTTTNCNHDELYYIYPQHDTDTSNYNSHHNNLPENQHHMQTHFPQHQYQHQNQLQQDEETPFLHQHNQQHFHFTEDVIDEENVDDQYHNHFQHQYHHPHQQQEQYQYHQPIHPPTLMHNHQYQQSFHQQHHPHNTSIIQEHHEHKQQELHHGHHHPLHHDHHNNSHQIMEDSTIPIIPTMNNYHYKNQYQDHDCQDHHQQQQQQQHQQLPHNAMMQPTPILPMPMEFITHSNEVNNNTNHMPQIYDKNVTNNYINTNSQNDNNSTINNNNNNNRKQNKISSEQAWNNKFQELYTFYLEFGHADVPQTYKKNKSLGKWVGKQREHYKTYIELNNMKFNDVGDNHDNSLMNTTVSTAATAKAATTTFKTAKKKTCPLTQERISKLLSINFRFVMGKGQYSAIHGTFTSSDTMIKAWEDKFQLLQQYKYIYGHVDVVLPLSSKLSPGTTNNNANCNKNSERKGIMVSCDDQSEAVLPTLKNYNTNKLHTFNMLNYDNSNDISTMETSQTTAMNNNDNIANNNKYNTLTEDQIRSLGRWLTLQKKKYKEMKKGVLSSNQVLQDRFQRLADIGVDLEYGNPTNSVGGTVTNNSGNHHDSTNHHQNLWYKRYDQLCEFKEKNGHVNVSSNNCESFPQLFRWVATQRESWKLRQKQLEDQKQHGQTPNKQCPLSDEKIELLKKIGFEFSMHDKSFHNRLNELKAYKAQHGHIDVRPSQNKTLYDWIQRQRNLFRDFMEGNTNHRFPITNERIALLEDIGFDWNYHFEVIDREKVQASIASSSDESSGKKRIKSNPSKNDKADLPQQTQPMAVAPNSLIDTTNIESISSISAVVNSQADKANMTPNHANKTLPVSDHTSAIQNSDTRFFGTDFISQHKKGTKPRLWKQNYDYLVAFHQVNGHCRVPGKYSSLPKLGYWVKLQREDYKHMKEGKPSPMNQYRIDLLEKIGFEWSIVPHGERQNVWNKKFEELKAYKRKYGNCDVPQAFPLGKWASKQRDAFREFQNGKLNPRINTEKIEKLQSIGFRFVVGKGKATRQWDQFFVALVAFKEKFGHTNIPLSYEADPQLGKWAYQQRKNKMKKLRGNGLSSVTRKRLEQLSEIGFSFHVEQHGDKKRKLCNQEKSMSGSGKVID